MKPGETVNDIRNSFFRDLKTYNSTNFKTLAKADLQKEDASVHKAFSSVITRYFIFREKHAGEFTDSDFNMLYFKLKLDLISQYFSEYPSTRVDNLVAFQIELKSFIEQNKKEEIHNDESTNESRN